MFSYKWMILIGFTVLPRMLSGEESACNARDVGLIRKRKWQPTPVFLPGKSHRQRSLVGYSPCGVEELGMTEELSTNTQCFSGHFLLPTLMHIFFCLFSSISPLHTHTHTHTHRLCFAEGYSSMEDPKGQLWALKHPGEWAPGLYLDIDDTLSKYYTCLWASQVALVVKNLPANADNLRDTASIPGSGRSPGGGYGNPLQYSCLENPMGRRAWWATVCRVAKSRTQLKWLNTYTHVFIEKSPSWRLVLSDKDFWRR